MKSANSSFKSLNPVLSTVLLRAFGTLTKIATLACVLAIAGLPLSLQAGKGHGGGGGGTPPPSSYAYSMRQLDLPAGASSMSTRGMNNAGEVVGRADLSKIGSSGCLWEPNGDIVLLPLLPDAQEVNAAADSISDSGQLIAGSEVLYPSFQILYFEGDRAVFWERNADGTFTAGSWNDYFDQNPQYDIQLHTSRLSSDGAYAVLYGEDRQTGDYDTVIAEVLYNVNGRVDGINVLDVLPNAVPYGLISSDPFSGVVRVLGGITDPADHGFLWKWDGSQVTLNVQDSTSVPIYAHAVNKLGQCVAYTTDPTTGVVHTLLFEESQLWNPVAAIDLGSLGGDGAFPSSINDYSQVVGSSNTGGRHSQNHAFIWQNGQMTDLNSLAAVGKLVLTGAGPINNNGQILAGATSSGGWVYQFVLTPTQAQ